MDKAVQLANEFDADLFLLHVQSPLIPLPFVYEGVYVSSGNTLNVTKEMTGKMNSIVKEYSPMLKPGLTMNSSVVLGGWLSMMKESVIANQIDLILVPRSHQKNFGTLLYQLNINSICYQTRCPVLTITPELEVGGLKNIVVPVGHFLPIRKLTFATFLARRFEARVHLTASGSNAEGKDINNTICLAKSYQLLNKYAQVQIHYPADDNNTTAADSLAYAKSVNADLIVINPGRESKLRKWFSSLFGKYIYRESNIPILTVLPNNNF